MDETPANPGTIERYIIDFFVAELSIKFENALIRLWLSEIFCRFQYHWHTLDRLKVLI